jgi:hypothetical protein
MPQITRQKKLRPALTALPHIASLVAKTNEPNMKWQKNKNSTSLTFQTFSEHIPSHTEVQEQPQHYPPIKKSNHTRLCVLYNSPTLHKIIKGSTIT